MGYKLYQYPPLIIAERLNLAIYGEGRCIREICKRAKIGKQTMYSYLAGASAPNINALYRLEAVLGKPKGWLQGLKEETK